MIIEKDGKQVEVGHCCFMGCDKPAEFKIQKEGGSPLDDYTHACEAHVGALLMNGANRVIPHEGCCPVCKSRGHGLPCLTPACECGVHKDGHCPQHHPKGDA